MEGSVQYSIPNNFPWEGCAQNSYKNSTLRVIHSSYEEGGGGGELSIPNKFPSEKVEVEGNL